MDTVQEKPSTVVDVATAQPGVSSQELDSPESRRMLRKMSVRIIPLLFIAYMISFVDRINVGFTQLQMKRDLAMNDAQFGFAAGLFFITFVVLEVPSNLWSERIGMRKTLLRIMGIWGLISAGTLFVKTPGQFYAARLLLGAFEAGFMPAMFLYLSYWFPSHGRGRSTGVFMTAPMLAGMFAAPVSSQIMAHMSGLWGLAGWQWCFLLEGLPAVLLGIISYFYFDDRPEHSKWLTEKEKQIHAAIMEADRQVSEADKTHHGRWRLAFADPQVYVMSFLFFGLACGGQALIFWIPQIIRGLGVKSIANVGFLAAIPFATAIVILIVVSWTSDLCRERRWHYAVLALIQAAGCAILPSLSHSLGWSMVVLALSLGASASAIPFVFFIAPTYLRRQVVAIGVAIVNSLGLTAGFVGSSVLGVIKNHTGSFAVAFYIFSFLAVLAALTMLTLVSPKAVRVGISASK